MTDQKPDSGDPTESTDTSAASPDPEEAEAAEEPPTDAAEAASSEDEASADDADVDEGDSPEEAAADEAADDEVDASDTDEAAADSAEPDEAAPPGAAWTTTPVAPDPEATEAALAALAAKPETVLEAPESPPPPPGGEPPDEGTPVLLVGGILVGAFIVALAIVLILFRPFDNVVDPTLSPSPVVTEAPSASPSVIPAVDTPNFQGLTLEEAELRAEDYGLVVRANPRETDDFQPGTVLDQDPSPGSAVEPGTTVDLSVAVAVPTTPVPDVTDMTEDEAIAAIEDAGFVVGDIIEESSDDIEAGNVISTDPEVASELAAGSVIDLTVSTGPAAVPVPDLVDSPEADALTALEDAGLVAGDRSEASDESIVAGNVISSDPAAAAEVAPGSEVSYVVSTGPAAVPVPDLVDSPEADALTALEDAGLVAGDRSEASDESIVAGNVISSDPAAAAEVAPGSEVSYVVSTGPAAVPVPDLVDSPEADALTALEDAGLVAGDRSEASDESIVAGNVISSDPAAAAEVAPGSEVSYVVSTGPAAVPVPDLVDSPEADALTALEDAGLVAGDRSEASDESIVAGNVISSDPAAAAEVAPGSEVSYVVSTGPAAVPVPDLVDSPEADALTALEDAGLVAGDRSEASDESIVAGNVISSDPAAAAEVAPGSEVSYVVSTGPAAVPVPDLVDSPEADALTALEDAGLVAGDRSEASDESIVAGNVISSDPAAAAEVAPGSEVSYVVSTGPAAVPVPDLVDSPEADALTALEDAGLVAGDRSEASDESIVAGNVISSDPAAAAEVAPGSEVSYVVSTGPAAVPVPDLVDSPEADALTALEDAGLVAGDRSEASDESIVAGNVISSDPAAAAEVAPGSEVSYVVSTGPAAVPVPDLVDSPEADALTALEDAGLVAGDRSEASDESIVAGNVISSDPAAAAEVAPGSEVSYVVSTGPAAVPVPDLVDSPEADALTALEDAGLVAGDRSEASDESIVAGNVISSDPAAAAEVAPGSEVSYVVSTGPAAVPVPDLVDSPEADALTALEDAGLVAGDRSEASDESIVAGNVISSDPAAAAEVAPGSEVSYVVSLGVEPVEVPDLSGAAADADATISAAGLTVGSTSEQFSDSVPTGDVISQAPAAGTQAQPGSAVSYVVSLGVEPVEVPDLSGAAADADATISAAGLTVGSTSEQFSDSVPTGDVISQAPAAGTQAQPGSAVSYVVSLGVEPVEVPDLSGAAADADATISAAGLTVGSTSEQFSDSVPTGDVISQAPAAGTQAQPGSAVSYVVSLGVEPVEVPDLSGAAADADATISAAGLTVGSTSEQFSDSVPTGDVISQAPAAGTQAQPGSAVSYVVSLGVEPVEVPDLSGAAADADATISAAGLTVGSTSEQFSDSVPTGDVISQAPAAGTQAQPGSAVSYVVSLGVEPVEVPDLSGAAADADATISAAGLTVGSTSEQFSDSVPTGDVISQAPAAGTQAQPGSAVSYVVSLGVEPVEVPDLSGAAADADATISAAGLTVGSTSEQFSDSVPTGDVISQAPAAGTQAQPGSAVSYVVSLGVEPVEVPDLSGAAADADATISAAGLTVGSTSEQFSDSVPTGDVISQAPAAGTQAQPGSAVSYVVSLGVEPVEVPDLSGAAADADATISAAGLTVGSTSEQFSDSVPTGDVISQAPAAGTQAQPGSAVSYVVSLGVEPVEVPDLSGAAADADATISAAGLTVGSTSEQFSDSVPTGDVISQAPAAGTQAQPGSAVSYVVSLGVEPVEVPDLSGAAADADATISAAGLTVGSTSEQFSDSVPTGDVISQAPAAGTQAQPGSAVSYVVSLGVEPVEVPDLSGAAADADATISAAGLTVGSTSEQFSDSVPTGDVISQAPAAGTQAQPGSAVSYVVSLGVTPNVIVPNVRDLPEADAIAAIEGANLVVGETIEQTHEKVAAGDAVKTDPTADSEILHGSSVTLYVSTGSSVRIVPEVKGTPAADAQAALEAEGLLVATQERSNSNVEAGTAVKTEPAAGTEVEVGSEVLLTISSGPKPAIVPNIVGELQGAAKSAITDAGLVVGEATRQADPAPNDTVLSQNPVADTEVPTGTAVDYVVSSGPPVATIPEVKGTPAADAQAALEAEDLLVATQERSNSNVEAGTAVKTEPAAGTEVEVGSEVLLTISSGPKPAIVPNIVGELQGAAKSAITDAGLVVGEATRQADPAPNDTVLSQNPVADTEVPTGTAVDYVVSSGPPVATIPEVKGTPAADAQAALEAEGLLVATQERSNSNVEAGTAVKTEPAAGTEVEVGSEVLLTISSGPKPAIVPNIVGELQGAAKSAITDAGLVVGEATRQADPAPNDTVLSQNPVADTEVPTGTAVDYVVSSGPPVATIPEVKGTPAADAQAALEAEGLLVATQERSNSNVEAGTAVKTEPAAGTEVEVGSEVLLTISSGPKPAIVPNIVGAPRSEADAAITAAKLVVGDAVEVENDAAAGTVLSQEPAADGEAPQGSSVNYTYSVGPQVVTVPEVKDAPAADAQAALEAEGLTVTTQEKINAKVAKGGAVKTEPAAGSEVEVGSEVMLTISKGPKQVVVPDVVGMPEADAKADIEAAGLQVGDVSQEQNGAPAGTVLSQDPAPASKVNKNSPVAITISSSPPAVTVPNVKDLAAADAQAALEAEGLLVTDQEKFNASVEDGNAVKTDPAAGTEVEVGSEVVLTISKGPKQETVPDITGLSEPEAIAVLEASNLDAGERSEVIDEIVPAGLVIDETPDDGTAVDQGTAVDYTVSLGPPIEPRGAGGSLDNETVSVQLDGVAASVPEIRELELGNTPYDGENRASQESLLAERADILHDPATIGAEQDALSRMGLLGPGDDLAALLDELYGQNLPIAYLPDRGRQSILQSIDKFNVPQRALAAREFGRAAAFQAFGSDATRVGDRGQGDEAMAALALEQGDGTATMLDWSGDNVSSGNQSKVDGVIVPGNDGIYNGMPQLLQREYSFPFLEGRAFVDQLRKNGGWDSVNAAWGRLPESTEQVMHPKKYGSDRPTSIDMSAIESTLGGGWSEQWQQTMGELRIGVWLADGQPGTQDGPKAPVKLPNANAAAGWGGDRLVSLGGPDGSWAVVWQTKWDEPDDVAQFTNAANAAIGDLPGAHVVLATDVSGGASNPALVLLTSDEDTLAAVAESLGIGDALGSS